jgi:hypothetical protein
MDAKSQRNKVLSWLREKPLTTLEARNQLFIMSIAARVFELKARGYNIVTHKVQAGRRVIAQYVLLSSPDKEVVCDE